MGLFDLSLACQCLQMLIFKPLCPGCLKVYSSRMRKDSICIRYVQLGIFFVLTFSLFNDISFSAGEEGKNKYKSLCLTDTNKQQ